MFDVVAMGELLIDFTPNGENNQGITLFGRNPGGAPANVLAMNTRFGGSAAFIGKGADGYGMIPTYDVNTIDTTGAGDAFLGAVHYRLRDHNKTTIKELHRYKLNSLHGVSNVGENKH